MCSYLRTALVTGANRGVGFAIAQQVSAGEGVRVLAAARNLADAQEAAKSIGGGTVGVSLDLSDTSGIEALASEIEADHGPIDILVNNAGILVPGDGLAVSTDDFRQSLEVNAVAPFALIRVLGRAMTKRSWGRVVNVSSGWGAFDEGLTGPAAYSISKATLNAVTVTFAQNFGRSVKVNAACPGWVRTRMGGQGATRSPEEGAATPVWLATLPDDGPTGGFFRDGRLIEW